MVVGVTVGLFAVGMLTVVEVVLLGLQGRRGGVVQVEAWGLGRSLLVGDEHGHGDGGLQQAGGGVLVVVAVVGVVVRVLLGAEAVVHVPLHAVRAPVLRPAEGRQHVHLTLEEAHVSEHVALPLWPDVGAVTHVAQRGADHVAREDVPQPQLLPLLRSRGF